MSSLENDNISMPISFTTRKLCSLVSDAYAGPNQYNGIYGINSTLNPTSALGLSIVSSFQLTSNLSSFVRSSPPTYFWLLVIGY